MECNEFIVIKEEGGYRYIKGTIYADTMPATMPEDGTDIEGLSSEIKFAVGMSFFTPSETKVLFPSGWQSV